MVVEEDLARRVVPVGLAAGAGRRARARAVLEVRAERPRAGRPSRPIRSLRPLPRTRISPRRRSSDPRSAAASSLILSPAA